MAIVAADVVEAVFPTHPNPNPVPAIITLSTATVGREGTVAVARSVLGGGWTEGLTEGLRFETFLSPPLPFDRCFFPLALVPPVVLPPPLLLAASLLVVNVLYMVGPEG